MSEQLHNDAEASWFDRQRELEQHPVISENISEIRDWLLTESGQSWLVEQLRLPRLRGQRRRLRKMLQDLP